MKSNYITDISLVNFQIFKKLDIQLCKGFNCITGNNNEGKSTIMRAVEWIFTNSPSGDWMCRRDEYGNIYPATVKLVFSDGNIIKRVKGVDKNYYVLNEEEYHEINRAIPVEVDRVLGINRQLFHEIKKLPSISSQDEQLFLIFDTKPDKGRAINVLTGTNLAERALKSFNKDRLQLSREITFNNKRHEELKETIKGYRYLKKMEPAFNETVMVGHSLKKMLEEQSKLETLVLEYEKSARVVQSYDVLRKNYEDLDKLEAMHNDCQSMKAMLTDLLRLKKQYTVINALQEPSEVNFDQLVVQYDKCAKMRSELSRMQILRDEYNRALIKLNDHAKNVKKLKKSLTGKVCPTCNGKGVL